MTNPTANSLYPVANAVTSSSIFVDVITPRAPTQQDNKYQTQKKWLDTSTGRLWMLESFVSLSSELLANWILIGSSSLIEKLEGNTGGAVSPDASQVIYTVGDGVGVTVVGDPATNTLTWSLVGGGTAIQGVNVDADTSPGTNPVVPDTSGNITVTGGQVAAGTTANVIQTDSLAANTYTIQVQRSQATASSTVGDNGVCHFSSTDFSVDSNGFVSLKSVPPFFNYVQIDHAASPYTVLTTDQYISCDPTAGTISILLPNAPTLYEIYTIKDRTGQASINNISVTTVGGAVLIDGQTTYTLASNFSAIQLLFNGTSYEIY